MRCHPKLEPRRWSTWIEDGEEEEVEEEGEEEYEEDGAIGRRSSEEVGEEEEPKEDADGEEEDRGDALEEVQELEVEAEEKGGAVPDLRCRVAVAAPRRCHGANRVEYGLFPPLCVSAWRV